ncbi:hypothetical protein, partial [Alitiscatomonas aceti]
QKTIALKKPGVLRTVSFFCYPGKKSVLTDSPMGEKMYALYPIVQTAPESECKNVPDRVNTPETYFLIKNIGCPL